MPEKVISTNLTRLAFKKHFDNLEGRVVFYSDITSLIWLELKTVDKDLEGKQEIGLLKRRAFDFLVI